jgi:hypothetical protein
VYFEMNTARFRVVSPDPARFMGDSLVSPVIEQCVPDALSADSWQSVRDRDVSLAELASAVMSARSKP